MTKEQLLQDLESLSRRAVDARVTRSTQQAIDYAVSELRAEAESSRPSQPPPNGDAWGEIRRRFQKSREILRDIK